MHALSLCFVAALLALSPVTWADYTNYTIDDRDPAVQYIPPPNSTSSSFGWVLQGSDIAHDGTMTEGLCNTVDHCSFEIRFNASGITIYGYQYGDPLNFTASLDGRMAPPPPTFSLVHNDSEADVSLYNIQSQLLAFHTLNISLASSNGAPTRIYFDYASVNTTAPPPESLPTVSSPSAIPSSSAVISSPTQPASYHSHFPLGSVIGGSLAGLAVVGIILALLYLWRKKHMPVLSEIDPDDSEYQSSSAPTQTMAYTPFVSPLNATKPLHPNRSPNFMSEQHNTNRRITSSSISDSLASPVPPTSVADSTEVYQSIPSTKKNPYDDVTSIQCPPSLPSSSGRNQLTDAQADFVTSLYTHNVPAPAVARIVQRMMAGQEIGELDDVSTVADGHGVSHGDTTAPFAPPSYSES